MLLLLLMMFLLELLLSFCRLAALALLIVVLVSPCLWCCLANSIPLVSVNIEDFRHWFRTHLAMVTLITDPSFLLHIMHC